MSKLDPAIRAYRAERAKRAKQLAPLLRAAKRQYEAESEAWHAKHRARRTKRADAPNTKERAS